ncbi:MAG: 30S ribosomal protein S6 [Patescibacteria group bacterium]|nr:30S ribosomal protein S6 [Patescibacteria group bacterium]
MRNYQLVLVLRASLSEIQRKKLLATIKTWLKDVKIAKEEEWGQKPLAHSIKKETAGFYLNYLLEAKDVPPLDFEKKLMAQEEILRHLFLRR